VNALTEFDWLRADEPQKMLLFLRNSASPSEMKLRLWACACVRRVWQLLGDERSRTAVESAECLADSTPSLASWASVRWFAERARRDAGYERWVAEAEAEFRLTPAFCLTVARERAASAAARLTHDTPEDWLTCAPKAATALAEATLVAGWAPGAPFDKLRCQALEASERQHQCVLLRCLFGSLCRRPPVLAPSCLTPAVVTLAQDIYDRRAFERTRELADALEANGCEDAELLAHLRSQGPHVRGCFAVDAVLGRG
jgi:hypothetical protein